MKSLIFQNSESLNIVNVYQTNEYVHDTVRDVLEFCFAPTESLDKINELFTKDNCKTLIVRDSYEESIPVYDENGDAVLDESGNLTFTIQESYSDTTYNHYNVLLSLNKQLYLPNELVHISVRTAAMTETEIRLEELENNPSGGVPEEELNNSYNEGVNSL